MTTPGGEVGGRTAGTAQTAEASRGAWAARLAGWAVGLAVLLAAAAGAFGGTGAAPASAAGSCLAIAAQLTAVALLRPAMGGPTPAFVRRWAVGMAVRGASVVLLAALVLLTRGSLPALWTALGYLGVLLPLLFLEARFL